MTRMVEVRGYDNIQRGLAKIKNVLGGEGYREQLWEIGNIMRNDIRAELRRAVYDTPPGHYVRTGYLMATIYVQNYDRNDFAEVSARGNILVNAVGVPPSRRDEYRVVQAGPEVKKTEVKVVAAAIYADRVEYGPHIRGARPFMRPAVQRNSKRYVSTLQSRMRTLLSKAAQYGARFRSRDSRGRFT